MPLTTEEKKYGRDHVPPMVQMDEFDSVPGAISQKESFKQEVAAVTRQNVLNKAEAVHTAPQPHKLSFIDPDNASLPPEIANEPLRTARNDVEPVSPNVPDITETIAKQHELNHTVVKAPEGFDDAKPEPQIVPPLQFDRTNEAPIENEYDTAEEERRNDANSVGETIVSNAAFNKDDVVAKPGQYIITLGESTPESEIDIEPDRHPIFPHATVSAYVDRSDVESQSTETSISPTTEVDLTEDMAEMERERKESATSEDEVIKNAPDNLPEGTYVKGMTDAEILNQMNERQKRLEAQVPIAKAPAVLDNKQLDEIRDYSTTHYRIIQGLPYEKRLRAPIVDTTNIQVIKNTDVDNFEIRKTAANVARADGERRVQIVCTQSGYSCICKPMNSRELRTFGRDTRSQLTDSYNTNMVMCQQIYSKLGEFSCGSMTYEDWINHTAFPDLQTCIFGIYMATYPQANSFNLSCSYCGNSFSVMINNDTLIYMPVGSTTQEMIQQVLSGSMDPRKLLETSKRRSGIRIFLDGNTRFFNVHTPSIMEFYEKAYRNKNEDVINENQNDMYYAGYITGYGVLDIQKYNETGQAEYLLDTSIPGIDKAIADLDPDSKEIFERRMLDYINKFSISYQIPRVQCPHCRKIMSQREVNMRQLFFEVRAQKVL